MSPSSRGPVSTAASKSPPTASSCEATLGFLYASFSEQIEQRLQRNLDRLLGEGEPADDAYNDDAWR